MRKPRDLNFKVKCPTSSNTAQGEYVQLRVFLLTVSQGIASFASSGVIS